MASNDPAEAIKLEAICSICKGFYQEPVTIECGHYFCLTCLTRYMDEKDLEITCPECALPFDHSHLIKIKRLNNIAENAERLKAPENPLDGGVCEDHGEKLRLFCKVDQRFLCLVCREASEHQEHQVRPIKEAETAYKKRLKDEEQNIETKFEELQLFLKEIKNAELGRLRDMKKNLEVAEEQNTEKRKRKTLTLNSKMSEIEVMFKMSTVDFLQNVSSMLSRYGHVKSLEPEKSMMVEEPEQVVGNYQDERNGGGVGTSDVDHEAAETTREQDGEIQRLSPHKPEMDVREILHEGHRSFKRIINEKKMELGKHLEETQRGVEQICTVGVIPPTTTGGQGASSAQERAPAESSRGETVGSPVSGEQLGIAVGEVTVAAATQLPPLLNKVVAKWLKK
ncbi:zinc finger protein RFP-like [Lissotriton helveticus]